MSDSALFLGTKRDKCENRDTWGWVQLPSSSCASTEKTPDM